MKVYMAKEEVEHEIKHRTKVEKNVLKRLP
jgi:hypothetical protein